MVSSVFKKQTFSPLTQPALLVSSPGHSVTRAKNEGEIAAIFLTYCQSTQESLIAVYNSLCNVPYKAAEATRHCISRVTVSKFSYNHVISNRLGQKEFCQILFLQVFTVSLSKDWSINFWLFQDRWVSFPEKELFQLTVELS